MARPDCVELLLEGLCGRSTVMFGLFVVSGLMYGSSSLMLGLLKWS